MFRSDEKGDYKSSRADLVVLVVLGLDKQIGPVLGGQAVTPVQTVAWTACSDVNPDRASERAADRHLFHVCVKLNDSRPSGSAGVQDRRGRRQNVGRRAHHLCPLLPPVVPSAVGRAVPKDEQETDDDRQERRDIVSQGDLALKDEVEHGDERSPDGEADDGLPDPSEGGSADTADIAPPADARRSDPLWQRRGERCQAPLLVYE